MIPCCTIWQGLTLLLAAGIDPEAVLDHAACGPVEIMDHAVADRY
jgi:hypothetical protein